MADFRMPSLGADMEAGTLVEWLVKPGDRVKRGDIVAVVETQKGAIEIETFQEGQIEEILVGLNSKVPVGTPLARIRTEGETAPAVASVPPAPPPITAAPPIAAAPPPPIAPAPPIVTPSPPAPVSARVQASPAARKLAEARGIDLSTIAGSGPFGAITYADVERHVAGLAPPPAPAPGSPPTPPPAAEKKRTPTLDLDAMRIAIAAAMARSKREIPHYYLSQDIDITDCERWLAEKNASLPPDNRLLMGALAIKAMALAARRFPAFNGFYRDNKYEPSKAVHIGVAIAIRGGGLTAPALHDADQLPLDELMGRLRDLVQRTRAGRIRGSEMSDPTITVSSLGDRGVDALYGVIYPPQVAIVGFGKATARPWVIDGAIGPRSIITATLAADHRVSDGHAGALFLAEIGKLLQEPDKL